MSPMRGQMETSQALWALQWVSQPLGSAIEERNADGRVPVTSRTKNKQRAGFGPADSCPNHCFEVQRRREEKFQPRIIIITTKFLTNTGNGNYDGCNIFEIPSNFSSLKTKKKVRGFFFFSFLPCLPRRLSQKTVVAKQE